MLSLNQRPLYPASNKTVVVLARDAMYTASYTGLARLGAVATDDWMARTIAGVRDWGPPPLAWLMRQLFPPMKLSPAADGLRSVGYGRN